MVICVIAAVVNLLRGQTFTSLFWENFNLDPEVLHYSRQYLDTIAIFYPLLGILFLFRNGL